MHMTQHGGIGMPDGSLVGGVDVAQARLCMCSKGEGARSKLLVPGLLVNCADVELRIGDQTGQRDSFQRAHNLAQQATEHYRARWTKLVAIRSRRDTRSWWQRVGKSQEAAEIEVTPSPHPSSVLPSPTKSLASALSMQAVLIRSGVSGCS